MSRFDQLFQAARSRKALTQAEDPQPDPSLPKTPSPKPSTQKSSKQPMAKPVEIPEEETEPLAKHKNPDYIRTTVYLPKHLHRKLRAAALADNLEMSTVVEQLIQKWLQSRNS